MEYGTSSIQVAEVMAKRKPIFKLNTNTSIITLETIKYPSKHKCEACGSHWLKPDDDCLFCLYRKESKNVDSKLQIERR